MHRSRPQRGCGHARIRLNRNRNRVHRKQANLGLHRMRQMPRLGKCVINDIANEISEKAKDCDGFVFGSLVYYTHPSARLLSIMDRAFYSNGRNFAYKPAVAVLSARRAGCTASMDVNQQALHHLQHARCIVHMLEPGLRKRSRGGGTGRGGSTDDAVHRTQHGLAPEVHRGRKEGGSRTPVPKKVLMNFIR